MIYKLAYVGFSIMYLVGILFDSNFKNSWVKNIAIFVICFVFFMQLAGIA